MHDRIIAAFGLTVALSACAADPTEGKAQATVAKAREEKPAQPATETLALDAARSTVAFVGAKVTAQHPGRFKDVSGTISLVGEDPTRSRIELEVKTASLVSDEGIAQLEGHLKSPDFFDVEKYPTARFVSTEIGKASEPGAYSVTGNLEIRGTKKSVTFPATIEVSPATVSAQAEFGINRRDFGIVYPGMKDDLIKDNVLLKLALTGDRIPPAN